MPECKTRSCWRERNPERQLCPNCETRLTNNLTWLATHLPSLENGKLNRIQASLLVALVRDGRLPDVDREWSKQYRTVEALAARGLLVKHDDGLVEPTGFGREYAAHILTPVKTYSTAASKKFNTFWNDQYAHPKTYHYKPERLRVVCARGAK